MAIPVLAVFAGRTARRVHDRRGSSRRSLNTGTRELRPD
jgi:hypothetical protein